MIEKICKQCGNKFTRQSRKGWKLFNRQQFCSRKCVDTFRKGKSCISSGSFKKGHASYSHLNPENMPRGEKHHYWKGGRTKHPGGYILIYSPGHPFKDVHNYVFEHRLVMEAHIGRVLLPTERVHHINGIKDDNRIENLMLFSNENEHQKYHHPKGMRVDLESNLCLT